MLEFFVSTPYVIGGFVLAFAPVWFRHVRRVSESARNDEQLVERKPFNIVIR